MEPYNNSKLSRATLDAHVLGGEVCAWAPYFDDSNLLTELFPRAAAVAERLWSAESVRDVDAAEARLHRWRCRLLRRGLATAPVYGGVAVGASGSAASASPTTFGGHCEEGPWQPSYRPPF